MKQIVSTDHVLEIAGPRGQIWRPLSDSTFAEARKMAVQGNCVGALQLAEDLYVAKHGNMHGIAFRIRSVTETLTGLGSAESILNVPEQRNLIE